MIIEVTVIVRDQDGNIIPSVVEKVVIKELIINGIVVENLEVTQ